MTGPPELLCKLPFFFELPLILRNIYSYILFINVTTYIVYIHIHDLACPDVFICWKCLLKSLNIYLHYAHWCLTSFSRFYWIFGFSINCCRYFYFYYSVMSAYLLFLAYSIYFCLYISICSLLILSSSIFLFLNSSLAIFY